MASQQHWTTICLCRHESCSDASIRTLSTTLMKKGCTSFSPEMRMLLTQSFGSIEQHICLKRHEYIAAINNAERNCYSLFLSFSPTPFLARADNDVLQNHQPDQAVTSSYLCYFYSMFKILQQNLSIHVCLDLSLFLLRSTLIFLTLLISSSSSFLRACSYNCSFFFLHHQYTYCLYYTSPRSQILYLFYALLS